MFTKRVVLLVAVLCCLFALTPSALFSQATTSGKVTGTVTDPTGAAAPGATITLTQQGTNTTLSTMTDTTGIYLFPTVNPGMYSLKCTGKGFRTTTIAQVKVEVLRSVTIDIKLELGSQAETVEVVASMAAELQTTDASIGTVGGGEMLLRLPALSRSVTSVLLMQPAVSPTPSGAMGGGDDVNGGQVAGSNVDQTTFYVDGGDATSDLEGTNGYVSPPGEPQPAPFIAVPAESTQEFRVVTASPTAGFSRSQGGEVSILSKSGTNSLHGSAYEYYYGNATQGNSWLLNSIGRKQPHSVNNRFGGTAGGPILKNKLFIFGNYEGRRFYQNATVNNVVPTDSARQGILKYRDCALGYDANGVCQGGNVVQYDLATSTLCGAPTALNPSGGGLPCDPRTNPATGTGYGISPLIQQYFALLPEPNNFSLGDRGLNSAGYTATFANPQIEDLGIVRVDYTINPKWNVFATYHYNRYNLSTTGQFNISCSTPNCTTGADQLISATPVQPRFVTFSVQGSISSRLTSQTHGSYMRDWWAWKRAPVLPQLTGTDGALQVSGEGRTGNGGSGKTWGDPINYNTQNARSRFWAGRDYFVAEDMTWLHGTHTFSFGGGYYLWLLNHQRTDVVTGGLTGGPIYWVGQNRHNGGSFLDLTSNQRPPTCAPPSTANPAGITTNCLLGGGQVNRYITAATSLFGLLDRSSQVGTRNGDFVANPLGAPLEDHVKTHSFSSYFQDTWKIKPSLTLSYGLSYGVQFAPTEQDGKQVLLVFANSNQPLINARAYFQQRNAALTSGGFFASAPVGEDQTFGFSPIRHVPGRGSSATTSWRDLGPRAALAWNVPYKNRVFGDKQTVIRVGYSILWNRSNGVQEALTPLLGDGLATVVVCAAPTFNGTTTATCNPGGRTNANTGFRLGVDGSTVPIPAFSNAPIPLVPGPVFGLSRTSIQDPGIRQPFSHNVSVDIQRAFPHNWFIDVGYIGKFARNLWQNVDLNAADPYAKDPTSGQTLAQAFDCLSLEARGLASPSGLNCNVPAGTTTANSGFTPQPFFENAPYGCAGCTLTAANNDSSDLISGALSSFMLFEYDFDAPQSLDPLQAVLNNMTTDGGIANYNAGFVSVRKSLSQGLDLNFNYTWSHAVGTAGQSFLGQQYTFYSPPTPFNFFSGWGSNNGDRRHVINATWYYQLPFGKGRHFATSNNILDRIAGGWYVSGIYTWATGLPACIGADGDYGAITGFTCAVGPRLFGKTGRHNNVSGSGGIADDGDINLFADPVAVYNSLSRPLLSVNGRPNAENINLPRQWNVDLSVGKNLVSTERYKIFFTAEAFNAFNHPLFGTDFGASLDINDPHGFGVLNGAGADNSPRLLQLGLRFEF